MTTLTGPTPSTASRGVPCSRPCANTSRGWHDGPTRVIASIPIWWLAAHSFVVREESRRRIPQGPSLFALAVHPCIVEAIRAAESMYCGDLDFKVFFLDDKIVAGKAPAVQQFLATLELLLREIGLEVARNKTLVFCLLCRPELHTSRLRGLHMGAQWSHQTSWGGHRLSGGVRISSGLTCWQSPGPA